MGQNTTLRWLASWRVKSTVFCILGLIGGILLSALLLAAAWFLILMLSIGLLRVEAVTHIIIATTTIPLLFIGNALISQDVLGKYSVTEPPATVTVAGKWAIALLSPKNILTMLKMAADILFSGPRAAIWSAKQIGQGYMLYRVDVAGCAAVLDLLCRTGHRMSYQEITAAIPGLNPVLVFDQLRLLDGVLFLTSSPPGLSLESGLREALGYGSDDSSPTVTQPSL